VVLLATVIALSDRLEVHEHVSLASLTSLGVGGSARFFARARNADDVSHALDWAARRGVPVTILGGGSNVVVADAGVDGLVVTPEILGQQVVGDDGGVLVRVGAGEPWDGFVAACVERGWAGLECLSGIPGLTGATPIQNVGAYGQDVGACLVSVEVLDIRTLARSTLSRDACELGYRTSRFKGRDDARFVVLTATFRLRPDGAACLTYPEITRQLAGSTDPPTLAQVRAVVLATRRGKSMLLDPSDENGRSCGSFFLNPELTRAQADALAARSTTPPPGYPLADGRVKVPAAWLIEHAGFARGQRFGTVGISSRHALALVCHAGATAAAVVEAAHRVRDGVWRVFGVELEPEARFIGFGTASCRLPALADRAPAG
jgi:UDP-N-acetylmuramate dehydrogenase